MERKGLNEDVLQLSVQNVLFQSKEIVKDYNLESEICEIVTHYVFATRSSHDKRIVNKKKLCPICLEYIRSTVCILQCGHIFHDDCEMKWKERSQTCAVCRERVKYRGVLSDFWGAYVLGLSVKTLKSKIQRAIEMRQ